MAGSTIELGILLKTVGAGAVYGAISQIGGSMDKLRAQTDRAQLMHDRLGQTMQAIGAKGRVVADLSDEYQRLGAAIDAASRAAGRMADAQARMESHAQAMAKLKGDALGVIGLGATLGAPVKAAVGFESAMADVRKVVDGTDAEIAQLGDTLKRMTREIPLSADGLAALAASAGQLGVKLGDIPDFTKTVAKMSVAFDMAADEAGDAMAKVANVYGIPIKEIGRLGDAINQMSNESPAKAREIVNALSRVGGVAKTFGLSAEQAASLSGALIAMGKPPEVAATGINAMLTKLMTADKQGKQFQAGLAAIGTSAEVMKKAIQQDAQGAILGLLKSLEKLPKEQRMGVLVDLFGLEYADDIAALAGSLDVYVAQIDAARRAEGSMGKEFAARAATTANNWQLLKNNISELGIEIGSVLLPAVNGVIGSVRPVVESVTEWARQNKGLVEVLGKAAGALLLFKAGSLAARFAFHGLGYVLQGGILRATQLRSALASARLAMSMLSAGRIMAVGDLMAGAAASGGLLLKLREIANSGAPLKAIGWHLRSLGTQALAGAASIGGTLTGALRIAGQAVMWLGRAVLLNPIGLALSAASLLVYKFWGPISGFFKGVWQGLTDGLAPIASTARAAFAPIAPMLAPVGRALSWVGDLIGALLKPIEDTGGAAQAFGVRVGNAIASAIKMFLSLPGKLLALPGEMLKIGAEIVNGLIGGIQSRLAAAGEAIKGLGASVVSGLKNRLGIRSPSRVFEGLGGFVAQGFAGGIGAGIDGVKRAAGAMSAAALVALPSVPALHATKSGAGSAGAMQITFAPQITVTGAASPEAAREQVQQVVQMSFAEFEKLMRRYEHEIKRRSA
ncbi:phage tail tape measure protein [Thiofaba sp. EF100]|uniref:phage tail tape measure protein n=1 Tax=Thiofaba sp. EF100 TaxID=3121274 RepID=UPI0032220D65